MGLVMTNMTKEDITLISISDYVYYFAAKTPDAEAVVLGDQRLTYQQLADEVDGCAKGLISMGIEKGDRVATLCTPCPDYFIMLMATASLGAIWVGLNPKYTIDELSYVLMDAEPRAIFSRTEITAKSSTRNYCSDLQSLKSKCSITEHIVALDNTNDTSVDFTYDQFLDQGRPVETKTLRQKQSLVSKDDPALIVYTSGTSGKPKGALLPHGGLISCSQMQNRIYNCDPLRVVNYLPINHIGCVGDISLWVMAAGGTIVFMEHFDPHESMEIIQREEITAWGGVPTAILMCMALPNFDQYDLSSIQSIFWSGAAAPEELVVALSAITESLGNCYGQTETVGSITFLPPCNDVELLTNTIGKPPEGYDIRIVTSDGRDTDVGEVGEIIVKGDFIMTGYWRRPEATAETIDEQGYLHTGDLASWREDGYIKLVGRIKEMFKSGGYNVYPREIEQVLESFPSVDMAAVISVPDPIFSEVGYAFIIDSKGELDEDALKAHCRDHLANYKIPKKFIIKPVLPMLPIGKIDKMALKRTIS